MFGHSLIRLMRANSCLAFQCVESQRTDTVSEDSHLCLVQTGLTELDNTPDFQMIRVPLPIFAKQPL